MSNFCSEINLLGVNRCTACWGFLRLFLFCHSFAAYSWQCPRRCLAALSLSSGCRPLLCLRRPQTTLARYPRFHYGRLASFLIVHHNAWPAELLCTVLLFITANAQHRIGPDTAWHSCHLPEIQTSPSKHRIGLPKDGSAMLPSVAKIPRQ